MSFNDVLTPERERRLELQRFDAVRSVMNEHQLDHLLLTGFDHIRFALNYRTQVVGEGYDWFAAVLDSVGTTTVFLPWIDEPGVEHTASGLEIALRPLTSWAPAGTHPNFWIETVAQSLLGAKRVGIDLLDLSLIERLRERLPSVEFVSVTRPLYEVRKVKSQDEIVLLAASSQLNATAAEHAMLNAAAGMTDFEVLSKSMEFMQSHGAEHLSHSLCNHKRESGSWFAAGSTLREGDAFFFDTGCYGPGGYASDIARSGFIGEPAREVKTAWAGLLEAYGVAQELSRPGRTVSEIQQGVNDCLAKLKLPTTPYGVGHGVGLRICELPTIHRRDRMDEDAKLVEGEVIALEPETTVWIGADRIVLKIEDNFVVESDGCRLLSQAVPVDRNGLGAVRNSDAILK
jgi:Xaa-Pro dipeptidase